MIHTSGVRVFDSDGSRGDLEYGTMQCTADGNATFVVATMIDVYDEDHSPELLQDHLTQLLNEVHSAFPTLTFHLLVDEQPDRQKRRKGWISSKAGAKRFLRAL